MISSLIDGPVDRILGYGNSDEYERDPSPGFFYDIGWNWLRILKRFLIPKWGPRGPRGCPTFISCRVPGCKCGGNDLCPLEPGLAEKISSAIGTGIENVYEGIKYTIFYLIPDDNECDCGKEHNF